ncbi:MAG: hypothetical protein ACQER9_04300 [Nanobdellota archaeon]
MEKNKLELIVQRDYKDFLTKEVFEDNNFVVYKVHNEMPFSQSYLIATQDYLTRINVSDKEYKNVEVAGVSKDKLTLHKENPIEEGTIEKDITLNAWLPYDNQRFIFTKEDYSYWTLGFEPPDRLMIKYDEVENIPGAYMEENYKYVLDLHKNFVSFGAVEEFAKHFPKDAIKSYLEKEDIWYYPKRDEVIFNDISNKEKQVIKETLEKRIPNF